MIDFFVSQVAKLISYYSKVLQADKAEQKKLSQRRGRLSLGLAVSGSQWHDAVYQTVDVVLGKDMTNSKDFQLELEPLTYWTYKNEMGGFV